MKNIIIVLAILVSVNSFGQKGDTVNKKIYAPLVLIGNTINKTTTADSLLLNPTIIIHDINAKKPSEIFSFVSATVIIIPHGSKPENIFVYELTVPDLTEEIIEKIKSLKPQSVVLISEIVLLNSIGKRNGPDIIYTIKRPGE